MGSRRVTRVRYDDSSLDNLDRHPELPRRVADRRDVRPMLIVASPSSQK